MSMVTALFDYKDVDEIHLTITSNERIIKAILDNGRKYSYKVVYSKDPIFLKFLFDLGYQKDMRTWRFWNVSGKPWVKYINQFKITVSSFNGERGDKDEIEPTKVQGNKKRIFSIRTKMGTLRFDASSRETLKNALREKFPMISDKNLEGIMDNEANYQKRLRNIPNL